MSYDLGTAHGKIELDYDGKGAAEAAKADMDRLSRSSKDTDRDLKRFGTRLRGLGGLIRTGFKWGAITTGVVQLGAAAGSATIQILGMVPALSSIASLAAGLPALFAGGAAAVGVLKASFRGMDKVFESAFDPKKADDFNEAIKNLAPNAQSFARALKETAPQLTKIQQGIQQAFFSNHFEQLFPKLVDSAHQLQPELNAMAQELGAVGRQVAEFALSAQSVNFVEESIGRFRAAVETVRPAIQQMLAGLLSVGQVGAPLVNRAAEAINSAGTRFGEWMQEIAASGQLQTWIDTAISTLKTLGGILRNVGSILQSVFSVAQATGGGLLNTIQQVTGAFAAFFQSAQGKQTLTAVFTAIMDVARALTPVVTTLASALLSALGPAISELAQVLGPILLKVVQALAPAFEPLAQGLGALLEAVAPILVPIAQLAGLLGQVLGAGLQNLAAALGPVIPLLADGLANAIQTIAPVLTDLVTTALPVFVQMGSDIAEAFAPVIPLLGQFASTLVEELAPHIPELVDAVVQLAPSIVELAGAFAQLLEQGLADLIPMLPGLVDAFVSLAQTSSLIGQFVLGAITYFLQLITFLDQLTNKVTGAMSGIPEAIGGAFRRATALTIQIVTGLIAFVVQLPGRIMGAIASLAGPLAGWASRVWNSARAGFSAGVASAVAIARQLPGRVIGAVTALIGNLRSIATSAWNAARAAFSSGVASATATARTLPGRARAAIAALVSNLSSIARSAWNAAVSAFRSGVSAAAGVARQLPGAVRSAVGNLGGLLVGAGRAAVQGFVNGIRSGVGAAAAAARSLGASVMAGIRSTLKIGSPSREMVLIGRFVTQGLRNGLLGTAKQVQAAANKLGNMVRDAFSDKLISRRSRNTVLTVLARGSKQMVALVNRANATAAKLKTAQSNLADIQKKYDDTFASAVQKTKDSFSLVSTGENFIDLDFTKEKFQEAVQQAKDFARNIATLTKRGLNKDLLQNLVDAGADQGGAMAAALANSGQLTINQFNDLQKQMNGAANSVGKVTADAMYGAGLQAAKGLVNGLKAQQKSLDAQMVRMANTIVTAIKRALHIKSPSRVMFNLGRFTTLGLVKGIQALRAQVRDAAADLAQSSILPTVRLGLRGTGEARSVAAPVAPVSAGAPVVNQTINALPGMDARSVADYSQRRLILALQTGALSVTVPEPTPAGV